MLYVLAQLAACLTIFITNRAFISLLSKVPRLNMKTSLKSMCLLTFWDTAMIVWHLCQIGHFPRPLIYIVSYFYFIVLLFDLEFIYEVDQGRKELGHTYTIGEFFCSVLVIFGIIQLRFMIEVSLHLDVVWKYLFTAPFFLFQIGESIISKSSPITSKRYILGFYLPRIFTLVYVGAFPYNVFGLGILLENIIILSASLGIQYLLIYWLSARSRNQLRRLREIDQDCVICLDPLQVNEMGDMNGVDTAIQECLLQSSQITITACGHYFHADCIMAWKKKLRKKATCPVCRFDLNDTELKVLNQLPIQIV
eukprot:TRINITY_DN5704_c0_g3_i13.p1 TRINITY_DN5704_c0_g3~~TRINITY_DN5704_c0_g3_i13.p1  ORF type:complete len:309 (+),score=2.17 TRINITY_DN5704_c0_g3_i13:652-1578(+)